MTASASPADRTRCVRAGMDDLLVEPASPTALADVLRAHRVVADRSPLPPVSVAEPADA